LGECRRQAEAQRTGRKAGGESAFVTRATTYLRERLRAPVSLTTVARHCHMSPSTFSHRFKAEAGLTPMNWLARERMQAARRLLLEGRTAAETAAELGFANPFHFSRVFRKIEGVPPSQFQRLSRIPRGGGSTS
jgi:AraC-like DNA-binding protein